MFEADIETWKPIHDFPLYEISSHGRVRSLSRSYERMDWRGVTKQTVKLPNRIINGWLRGPRKGSRYKSTFVSLRKDGETFQFKVAHLVLEAFVGHRPDGMIACHNDGNPQNNRAENLRWDTQQANVDDSMRHGTMKKPPLHIGDTHHNAKLTTADISEILSTPITRGVKAALARQYSVTQTTIGRILDGRGRFQA